MVPAGDMFQKKIDELFHGVSNLFGIVDDILIAGFDKPSRDHDATLGKVFRIYRQAKLNLNGHKWCTSIPFYGKII